MIDTTTLQTNMARVAAASSKLAGTYNQASTEIDKATALVAATVGFLADPQRMQVEAAVQQQIDLDAQRLGVLANKLEAIPVLAP